MISEQPDSSNKSDDGGGDGEKTGTGTKAPSRKKARKQAPQRRNSDSALSAAQQSVNEQMRRVLEEDQYSAMGSIVDTDSDEEDQYVYGDDSLRLDRKTIQLAARKYALMESKRSQKATGQGGEEEDEDDDDRDEADDDDGGAAKGDPRKDAKVTKVQDARIATASAGGQDGGAAASATTAGKAGIRDDAPLSFHDPLGLGVDDAEDLDREGGSIFGQTTGSHNSTWVECDKCKKWRRLRGVVDEKKLPSKWYCTMNKNDPERNRCSAPEEEYEATHTPESAADARTRKHLRVWVRRLQCKLATVLASLLCLL